MLGIICCLKLQKFLDKHLFRIKINFLSNLLLSYHIVVIYCQSCVINTSNLNKRSHVFAIAYKLGTPTRIEIVQNKHPQASRLWGYSLKKRKDMLLMNRRFYWPNLLSRLYQSFNHKTVSFHDRTALNCKLLFGLAKTLYK